MSESHGREAWDKAPVCGLCTAGALISAPMGVRRFNCRGLETLYLSLGWRTVFREVSGGFAHRPTPYVLVHHDVDCEGIADLLTEAARAAHGVSLADLSRARGDALIAGREPARA